MTVLLHEAENASNEPINDDGIAAILRGAGGSGSHLRAVFRDGSLQALAGAAASLDNPLATGLHSYAAARISAAAINRELDSLLEEQQRYGELDRLHLETRSREEGGSPGLLDPEPPISGQGAASGSGA